MVNIPLDTASSHHFVPLAIETCMPGVFGLEALGFFSELGQQSGGPCSFHCLLRGCLLQFNTETCISCFDCCCILFFVFLLLPCNFLQPPLLFSLSLDPT